MKNWTTATMTLATILGLSLIPKLSYGGSAVRFVSPLLGVDKWSSVRGKVGEMASTAKASTQEKSGMTFFGDFENPKISYFSKGMQWESAGYGVINASPGSASSNSVIQFPLKNGSLHEVEMRGLFNSFENREIQKVQAGIKQMGYDQKTESVTMAVTSGKGARKGPNNEHEIKMFDFYEAKKHSDGSLISTHSFSEVTSGKQYVTARIGINKVDVKMRTEKNFYELPLDPSIPNVKGDIVNVEAEINGRVRVDMLDSKGTLYKTTYQIEENVPTAGAPPSAKAKRVGEIEVVKNGISALQANVKTYPAATSVPASGSVQGLKVAPAAGAQ